MGFWWTIYQRRVSQPANCFEMDFLVSILQVQDHPLTLTVVFLILVFFCRTTQQNPWWTQDIFCSSRGVSVEILSVTKSTTDSTKSFRMQASEVALELARGPSARKLLIGISRSGSESFGVIDTVPKPRYTHKKGMAFRKGSNNFMRIS